MDFSLIINNFNGSKIEESLYCDKNIFISTYAYTQTKFHKYKFIQ